MFATEAIWPAKTKIFTTWLFAGKCLLTPALDYDVGLEERTELGLVQRKDVSELERPRVRVWQGSRPGCPWEQGVDQQSQNGSL